MAKYSGATAPKYMTCCPLKCDSTMAVLLGNDEPSSALDKASRPLPKSTNTIISVYVNIKTLHYLNPFRTSICMLYWFCTLFKRMFLKAVVDLPTHIRLDTPAADHM